MQGKIIYISLFKYSKLSLTFQTFIVIMFVTIFSISSFFWYFIIIKLEDYGLKFIFLYEINVIFFSIFFMFINLVILDYCLVIIFIIIEYRKRFEEDVTIYFNWFLFLVYIINFILILLIIYIFFLSIVSYEYCIDTVFKNEGIVYENPFFKIIKVIDIESRVQLAMLIDSELFGARDNALEYWSTYSYIINKLDNYHDIYDFVSSENSYNIL